MKQGEFIFVQPGNPQAKPVSIMAWDINDAIEKSHKRLPPGRVICVNNRSGKPTIVDFEID